MFAGVYFLGVFACLMADALLPINAAGEWRGLSDMIAVGAYLLGVIPLAGVALIDSRLVLRTSTEGVRLNSHVLMVAVLLVVAYVAMIHGMLTPVKQHWPASPSREAVPDSLFSRRRVGEARILEARTNFASGRLWYAVRSRRAPHPPA